MDYLVFDPVPLDEECTQVGCENYYQKSRKEAKALIGQLKRQFGEPPFGCKFKIKSNPHDFGDYISVNIEFDDNNEECVNYAYNIEENFPYNWDEIAKKELEKDDENI
jgi:hypothetical protein